MSTLIAKTKYQLVYYLSTREAARLSGTAEHILLKAVCDQTIDGINLPGKEVFVRWEDCSTVFPSATMAHNVDMTLIAEARARKLNYRNSD